MLSKFNNKKHRRLTALLLCVALMLGSVTSVSADISAADSETEVQNYAEEPTTEAVSYETPEAQTEVQEGTPVAEETEAPAADTQQTEAHTEAATEAHTETAAETQAAETTETEVETETEVVAQQLEYEDDQVKVHVTASEEGIIPDHASLKVVPLVKQEVTNEMTDEQKQEVEAINKKYDEAEKKLTEKAEKEAYDIAGFLAYDISLVDADGNKVEPNGDVKVTMDYKQPVIADEAVQAVENTDGIESTADLDVTVMHLEEDEQGQVKDVVDMVADENTEANLETTDDQNVQKAEFVSDSFSTFTLTWKSNKESTATATMHLVDTEGNEIDGSQDNLSVTSAKVLQDIAPQISGYTYEKAMLSSYNSGTEITEIKVEEESWFWNLNYYWYYKTKGDSNNWVKTSGNRIDIYLVYEEISGLYIEDNIVDAGALTAKYMENTGTTEPKINSYEWYRSDSKEGEYKKVEKVNYQASATDIKSNLSPDNCSQLYPAYDEGARKWYIVKAILDDGAKLESKPFQVNYYNQLQNGSFENPEGNYQWSNADYKAEGVWQTTGIGTGEKEGDDIEIVNPSKNTLGYDRWNYSWVGGEDAWKKAAYDGKQFAELNCEAAGALYQDVLTKEGTALNYWLAHRARSTYGIDPSTSDVKYDTMYLVIMPTKTAIERQLTTQDALEAYLETLGVGKNQTYEDATGRTAVGSQVAYNHDGVMVLRVTSNNQAWQYINGINGYTATSSLTRFFFMAGKTSSGSPTVGNFLDQVGFSQELPPVADDEFSLQIKKTFSGLGSTDIDKVKKNISFKISATKDDKELTDSEIRALFGTSTIAGADMTQEMDGSLVYTMSNKKIGVNDQYKVTITEEKAGLDGYTLKSSASTSVQNANAEPVTTESSTINALKGKDKAIVTFTNAYEEDNFKNIHFTKIWDDANNEYGTRPSSLDVTLHATYLVTENGETRTETLDLTGKVTPSATVTLKDGDWKCSWKVPVYYKLADGTKVKIDYSVTEGENSSDYVYSAVTNGGKAISGDGSTYKPTFSGITPEASANSSSTRKKAAARTSAVSDAETLTADNTTSSNLGEPAHRKYITYNEDSSDYTLNLDVTGAKGSAPGVDVLFVIDTSGSMGSGYGNNNLLPTVKSLLRNDDGMVDKIFARKGNKNSVAFVSFSDKAHTNTTEWYGASGKEDFKEAVKALSASGGTNWTYAMIKAKEMLDQRENSGNDKVVIFLSDGEPTYTVTKKNGKWVESGYGYSTANSYYTDAAKQVTGSLASAKLYSVYLTSGTMSGMEKFSKQVNNSDLVDGTNLESALTTILNKTIPTYKNVTITDTLSDYVDFAENSPTITVTKKTSLGTVTTLSSNEYAVTRSGKTVAVTLLNNASLEDGATYTISFKVKPSDEANRYYAENQSYPHTGDAGTGTTSAGRKGFYSNESANLTYEIDGTNEGLKNASYQKPVVQVTTHTLSYQKVWNQPDSVTQPTTDVVLNVTYTDSATKQITLTSAKDYSYQETVPITRGIQSINEEPISDYEASYSITDNGTSAVVTNNYKKVTASTITVNKVWVGGKKSDVRVSLYQNVDGGAANLYETVTLNEANRWTYSWEKLPQSASSGSSMTTYSYSVREESIPTNYQSSISYKYGNNQITATITNTYDQNCADENYYIANVLQTEELHIAKVWKDSDNVAGLRPDKLSVTVDGKSFELSGESSTWTKTATVLKKKNVNHSASETLPEDSLYEQDGNTQIENVNDGVNVTFTNKLKTTSITVKKEWNDGGVKDRPKSVAFRLKYRTKGSGDDAWTTYGGDNNVYHLTEESSVDGITWATTINNLPLTYDYQVVELNEAGETATADNFDNYVSTVTVTQDRTTYTMTNTLKWSAMKVSEEWDESNPNSVGLEGAKFELKLGDTVIATGESKAGGSITWTVKNSNSTTDLYNLNGTYTIHETKAPTGYMLHEDWTVTFDNGLLTDVSGQNITKDASAKYGVVIKLADKKVYVLPETGGSGIYWFSICGMLLMMAAAWIIYKNKCREVLVK